MTEKTSALSSYLAQLREKARLLAGREERPKDLTARIVENITFLVGLAKPELKSVLDVNSDRVILRAGRLLFDRIFAFAISDPHLTFHITEGRIFYVNDSLLYDRPPIHIPELLPATIEDLIREDRGFFKYFGNMSKQAILAKVIEAVEAKVKHEELSSLNWTSAPNTI